MFFDEITPVIQEFTRQPLAFLGGLCAGILQLNVSEEPLKGWLEQQHRGANGCKGDVVRSQSQPERISID